MAADDDEALRLNTLHRFAKHSPRLLLQEYSHCEVPAGCGGVVLRWIDREQGLPVMLRVASLAKRLRVWIDGVEQPSSTFDLLAGAHVLALELIDLPRADTPMLARVDVNLPNDNATVVRSAPDQRWWTTLASPPPEWPRLDYECREGAWSRSIGHPSYENEVPQDQRWRWSSLTREPYADRPTLPSAARPLQIPGTHAWLRCAFELDAVVVASHLADAERRARG